MAVLCDMGFKSLAIIEEWIAEDAIACDYARDGWLDVVMRPEHMDAAEAEAKTLVPYGYRYERLDGDAARRFDPVLRDEVAGAIHYLDSAHCHPGSLLDGIAAACVRRGARLRTDAEVVAIERDRTGRASGARLATGEVIEADAVVLAAGVWSTELAKSVGLHMPLVGARGYHIQCRELPRLPRTGMVLHETFVAVTPMRAHGAGRVDELRLAGTLEIDRLGMPWRRERLAMLRKNAERYLHGIDRLSIASEWAGYRPCTSDGMPIVGVSRRVPGLVINGGHAMMGMTLGPISAKAAVEDLFGEKPSIDLGMLRADRWFGAGVTA
jgi:D-amino-acid dehydrogenase